MQAAYAPGLEPPGRYCLSNILLLILSECIAGPSHRVPRGPHAVYSGALTPVPALFGSEKVVVFDYEA
eukprot:scaffold327333_cov22-Prasinocladus_malaysianus.AAC.1